MNILCPACHTRYRIDPDFPEEGRKVRCAKCAEVWHARPLAPQETVETTAQSGEDGPAQDTPMFDLPLQEGVPDIAWAEALAEDDGRNGGARLVDDEDAVPAAARITVRGPQHVPMMRALQAFLVGVTAAGLFAAFSYKEDVVGLFPSTARLYAWAGIEVNIRGLAFENLRFDQGEEGGVPVLSVSGEIVNIAGAPVSIPPIRLSLAGQNRPELYSWAIEPSLAALGPGERLPFTARLAAPPREATIVSVRFADALATRIGLAR